MHYAMVVYFCILFHQSGGIHDSYKNQIYKF